MAFQNAVQRDRLPLTWFGELLRRVTFRVRHFLPRDELGKCARYKSTDLSSLMDLEACLSAVSTAHRILHAHTVRCIFSSKQKRAHTHIFACMKVIIHEAIHESSRCKETHHTYTNTNTQIHTHTHMHAYKHTHLHTYTHIYTHTHTTTARWRRRRP